MYSFSKKNNITIYLISLSAIILLLSARVLITQSLMYVFLLWNIFLAFIPYGIGLWIQQKRNNLSKIKLSFSLILWLLFLPNASYIVTDFVHLRLSTPNTIWLDTLLLFFCSSLGLLLSFSSTYQITNTLFSKSNSTTKLIWLFSIHFAISFGVYLGRFLRWNSWDFFHYPFNLFTDIVNRFTHPLHYINDWSFILLFQAFISFSYYCYQYLKQNTSNF